MLKCSITLWLNAKTVLNYVEQLLLSDLCTKLNRADETAIFRESAATTHFFPSLPPPLSLSPLSPPLSLSLSLSKGIIRNWQRV